LFLEYAPGCGSDEVPDPYYGGQEEFERVLDLCEAGARGLLRTLAPGSAG
jgi:protein-tyrosine phosphatase